MSSTLSSTALSLAERTLELCRISSPIGQERELADWVEAWARRHYPSSEVLRYSNSLAIGALSALKPSICLAGHLDTIPLHPTDREPRIEGERIFGRGSSDMKGGLAVMMALAEALPTNRLPYNLVLLFYEREEGPYLENGLGLLCDALPQLRSLALAITMEPTDNVVQVGSMGSAHATVRFFGKAAHSARPWQGENAIHKAGPLLVELLERPRREVSFAGFPFYEVFTVTKAGGGRARNVVPDSFEMNLNYRFAPGKSLEEAQREVRELVGDRAQIEFADLAPSGRVCTDNPLFKALLSVTGLPAASKQAWTDVARFSAFGVDAVNFGPGSTAQAHQENESASIAALDEAYGKLAAFLTAA